LTNFKIKEFYLLILLYLLKRLQLVNIDIYPYDLPRELSERRLQLERTKGYKQILEFKDEVVFKLLVQKKELETKLRDDMDKAANEEINEWARSVGDTEEDYI
jgi:hypothetical protein